MVTAPISTSITATLKAKALQLCVTVIPNPDKFPCPEQGLPGSSCAADTASKTSVILIEARACSGMLRETLPGGGYQRICGR